MFIYGYLTEVTRPGQVNVLVDANESAQIADFGLAVFTNGHSQNYVSVRTGNYLWMAPELMRRVSGVSVRATCASDVYSFSHVCLEVCRCL
jgi:serine/threonine-protein kinase TNNI3K